MELDGPTSLEPHRSHTCVSQLPHRSMRQTLIPGFLVWGTNAKDRATPVRVEKAFSAIITRKQFERVAKLMTPRAPKIANPRRVGSPFLLSGLVKCKTYRRDHRGFRPASVESPEGRSSWRQEPEAGLDPTGEAIGVVALL